MSQQKRSIHARPYTPLTFLPFALNQAEIASVQVRTRAEWAKLHEIDKAWRQREARMKAYGRRMQELRRRAR
jgi:hypothetical protein